MYVYNYGGFYGVVAREPEGSWDASVVSRDTFRQTRQELEEERGAPVSDREAVEHAVSHGLGTSIATARTKRQALEALDAREDWEAA